MHISNRDIAWYNLAMKIATDSSAPDPHGCVLVRSGTVLGVATNRYTYNHLTYRNYIKQGHAEQRVLTRVGKWNTQNTTLYSARSHWNPISIPCNSCYTLLLFYKVRWVVYHDGQTLIKARVSMRQS